MSNNKHIQSKKITELEDQIRALQEFVSLQNDVIAQKDEAIARNDRLISEKDRTINNLDADNLQLKHQLEQLKRMLFGSKSERFIPQMYAEQLTLDLFPKPEEIEEEVDKENEKIRVEYERKKAVKKHPGRMTYSDNLPVNEIIIEPNEDTADMVYIGEEITEELDYTPAKLVVNRYIRKKYITKEDSKGNQQQVIAPLERPLDKCIASTSLVSNIFVNKFLYHLPYHRILHMLSQMGVQVPKSTLESWVKLGANRIRALYKIHQLCVYREIYQMIDESPIKVQDRNKKGICHQGYMWVRYAPLSKSVLFEYHKSRSAKGAIDDLNTFKGFIQTDGYSGYTSLSKNPDLIHLSCWAHARRYFEHALTNHKEYATYILTEIQKLYAVEEEARENNLSHDSRHALRLEKSLPVINDIGKFIFKHKGVPPRTPIGKAILYCINHWDRLQNYLHNGILEIDSNLVENAIRPLAIGRKNYLFAGSHDAASDIAMFYSFFGTCKKHDIEPQSWLKYVMDNIQYTPSKNFKDLLPQFIDKNLL